MPVRVGAPARRPRAESVHPRWAHTLKHFCAETWRRPSVSLEAVLLSCLREKPELRPPLPFGDVREREPVAEALDADSNQADAHPAVEPPVEQAQLGRARWQPEEAEGGGEEGAPAVRPQSAREMM